MFDELTPSEVSVLRQLAERGTPVSEVRFNTDALRTLGHRRLIKRMSGFSVITPEGRRALQALERGEPAAPPQHRPHASPFLSPNGPPPPAAPDEAERNAPSVNTTQEEMLRHLALAESPMPFDDLDGRVVRALEGRGLVRKAEGLVLLTDAGRAFYESKVRRRRRARSGWVKSATAQTEGTDDRHVRARSIREAVDALQRAIGGADRILIGEFDATADEAFAALLDLAERIERGADPRRITRG